MPDSGRPERRREEEWLRRAGVDRRFVNRHAAGAALERMTGMTRLNVGDRFPELTGRWDDGRPARIPNDLDAGPSVLLFYRGHW